MIEKITLLGSSSGRNAGDAALMSGIMDSVDQAFNGRLTYEIPTINPSFVRNNYKNNVNAISMMPWNLAIKMLGLPTYNSIMRTDLSVVFDAILFDRALYNPLFNFLSSLYLMLPSAKRNGKKLAFFNVGCGPVTTPTGRKMLREVAELMDFITVRDQDSYDILKDIGVKNPRILLTADAALNVQASSKPEVDRIMARLGLENEKEIFAININQYLDTWAGLNKPSMGKEKFLAVYAAVLSKIAKELNVPMLFVCTQHHDVTITKELMAKISSPNKLAIITNTEYNHYQIKGVLGRASLLFAMRLHAMILASSEHTPVVGLAYQPKCRYYFKCLDLLQHNIEFSDFSEEHLLKRLLSAWESRADIRRQLDIAIPALKYEALKASKLVLGLNQDKDIERMIGELKNDKFNPQQVAQNS
jgi:polysaccharide pyruvyl transferase WcaK-like protein